MRTIPIVILAEDIRKTEYTNATDCAITRAVRRLGYPWHHGSMTEIRDQRQHTVAYLPHGISTRVITMYRHAHPKDYLEGGVEEPADIHTTITLTEAS